jgi:predicted anti-sigma-YlaC factor YlaD
MSISRNVILDLLPVYLAGEASEDTRTLIEEYLQSDKELAQMVAESNKTPFAENIKTPINKETEMESLRKAQAMIHRTIIFAAGVVLFVCISLMLVTAGLVYVVYN